MSPTGGQFRVLVSRLYDFAGARNHVDVFGPPFIESTWKWVGTSGLRASYGRWA